MNIARVVHETAIPDEMTAYETSPPFSGADYVIAIKGEDLIRLVKEKGDEDAFDHPEEMIGKTVFLPGRDTGIGIAVSSTVGRIIDTTVEEAFQEEGYTIVDLGPDAVPSVFKNMCKKDKEGN